MITVKYFSSSTTLSNEALCQCTFLYINNNRLWIYKARSDGLPIFNRTGKLESISSLPADESISTIIIFLSKKYSDAARHTNKDPAR